jgi:hypothetical protein
LLTNVAATIDVTVEEGAAGAGHLQPRRRAAIGLTMGMALV